MCDTAGQCSRSNLLLYATPQAVRQILQCTPDAKRRREEQSLARAPAIAYVDVDAARRSIVETCRRLRDLPDFDFAGYIHFAIDYEWASAILL